MADGDDIRRKIKVREEGEGERKAGEAVISKHLLRNDDWSERREEKGASGQVPN